VSGDSIQAAGSSPRMWGICNMERFHDNPVRFIPTHVGNIIFSPPFASLFTVHPHACGEYLILPRIFAQGVGSSPRMWGIFGGDNANGASEGSSPRMWGILDEPPSAYLCGRFIPTHVGNIWRPWRGLPLLPVHPHACGEYGFDGFRGCSVDGSSPRMWGISPSPAKKKPLHRFIPTHVGNMFVSSGARWCLPVHPHACGEYLRQPITQV